MYLILFFDIVVAVISLAATIYLLNARTKPNRYKVVTKSQGLYRKIFTDEFFQVAVIFTTLSVLLAIYDVLKSYGIHPNIYINLVYLAMQFVGSIVILRRLYLLFHDPKKKVNGHDEKHDWTGYDS